MTYVWYSSILNTEGKVVLTPVDIIDLAARFMCDVVLDEEWWDERSRFLDFGDEGPPEFDTKEFKKQFKEWIEENEWSRE